MKKLVLFGIVLLVMVVCIVSVAEPVGGVVENIMAEFTGSRNLRSVKIEGCVYDTKCQDIDSLWKEFGKRIGHDEAKKGKVWIQGNQWEMFDNIWPGNPVLFEFKESDFTYIKFNTELLKTDEQKRLSPEMIAALKKFETAAITKGYTGYNNEIIINSAYREEKTSHHSDGNAVDIATNDLTTAERWMLINAAIEVKFGEIYYGEAGCSSEGDASNPCTEGDKPYGLTSAENNALKCFWWEGHGHHLHLAIEDLTQCWESCGPDKNVKRCDSGGKKLGKES